MGPPVISKHTQSNTMGWLSTHVLDTANGCPAANMEITLWRVTSDNSAQPGLHPRTNYQLIKTVKTNQDGRTDNPLLEGEAFQIGFYELMFVVSDYFAHQTSQKQSTNTLPFLDIVPIRFGITDTTAHYHVPLLVSPWSYSTYRGS